MGLNRFFVRDVISFSLFFFLFQLVTEQISPRASQDSSVCLLTHSFFDSHCLVSDVCLATLVHVVVLPFSQHKRRWLTKLSRQTKENLLRTSSMCLIEMSYQPITNEMYLLWYLHCFFCVSLCVQVIVHHGESLPSYPPLRFCGCVYVNVFAWVCVCEKPG